MDFLLKAVHEVTLKSNVDILAARNKYNRIIFYKNCSGYIIIDGQRFDMSPGSIAVVPGDSMLTDALSEPGKLSVLSVLFECLSDTRAVYPMVSTATDEQKELMASIRDEQMNQQNFYLEAISAKIDLLLISLYRQHSETKAKSIDNLLGLKYIQSKFMENISVEQLAEASGYASTHFRRLFKQHTGMTPKQYIATVRIEHAMLLLKYSKASVSEIAASCGFYDATKFGKKFKELVGQTPNEYRKDCKGVRADFDLNKILPT